MESPLHQFIIKPLIHLHLGGYDISFTNASLVMCLAVVFSLLFFLILGRKPSLVPSRPQALVEMSYNFIASMIHENVGPGGKKYIPFVFSLFMFILMGNMIGMIPGAFAFTSHVIVTFTLASIVFIGVTILGIAIHGLGFIRMFFPHGTPLILAFILIPIELISYLSRPISLSARLFANIMAGHMILKIFAGFVTAMGLWGGWIPLGMTVILTGFEFFVAVMQAYIFSILTCIYLNDALHLH